jgi:hypothetical protein
MKPVTRRVMYSREKRSPYRMVMTMANRAVGRKTALVPAVTSRYQGSARREEPTR